MRQEKGKETTGAGVERMRQHGTETSQEIHSPQSFHRKHFLLTSII